MLATLAILAALAGPTVDLPELFSEQLPRVSARSDVPVLLPQTMPDEFEEYHPTGFGRTRQWGLQLGAAPGCGGATACFIATFSGREGGKPVGPQPVRLAEGRKGRFKPLTCGASCSPPSIEWKERGATFRIQAKVRTEATERRILKRMASSAIRRGPR